MDTKLAEDMEANARNAVELAKTRFQATLDFGIDSLQVLETLFDRVLCVGGAVTVSQAPEFIQQYLQRLGGRLDEARRQLSQFDDVARKFVRRDRPGNFRDRLAQAFGGLLVEARDADGRCRRPRCGSAPAAPG